MPEPPRIVALILATVCSGLGLLMVFWRPGPNRWIGVRLPWTFADRELWDLSWRLGIWCLFGMAAAVLYSMTYFLLAAAALIAVGCGRPTYLYWRRYGTLRFWKDMGWEDYRPVVRCQHCGHYQKLPEAIVRLTARCEACGLPCRTG